MTDKRDMSGVLRNTFDPDSHSYAINGRHVPSVTQVLGDLIPGWHASDWHMQRGRAVHQCAALIAQGKTFEHDPQIDGQVHAIRRFMADVKPAFHFVEHRMFSAQYQYAGCLDAAGDGIVWDYKATLTPSMPYQLGAYAIMLEDETGKRFSKGFGVEISADGTYRLSEAYDLRRYRSEWLALLTAYNVRRKCKVKEETGEE